MGKGFAGRVEASSLSDLLHHVLALGFIVGVALGVALQQLILPPSRGGFYCGNHGYTDKDFEAYGDHHHNPNQQYGSGVQD